MVPIIMPQVGQDYPTGTIVQWLKKPNDPVAKGETIVLVESEKATFEVEAEESGVLAKILHPEGAEVEILKPIGYVGQPGEADDTAAPTAPKPAAAEAAQAPETPSPAATTTPVRERSRPFASPSARRLARQHGLDLAAIEGSGPRGRIVKRDVLAAVDTAAPAKTTAAPAKATAPLAGPNVETGDDGDEVQPFSRMRAKIAERLTHSKQTKPHFYLSVDVDVTDLLAWRARINQDDTLHLTVTDLIVKATAAALTRFGRMNAYVDTDRVVVKKDVNVGVAVSVPEGLLVPVIPSTNRKSLREISALSRENTSAAARGSVKLGVPGTFTVSTLGMYGIRTFLPIINPPECAILAVGAAEKRVVPVDGNIGIRDVMSLTLACDHRGVDGAYAAQFLREIRSYLQDVHGPEAAWTV